jgi:hypothetical protein
MNPLGEGVPTSTAAGTMKCASDSTGSVGTTKRVLSAIAQVLPDDGHNYLTNLDIRRGWGTVLNVQLHTPLPRSEAGRAFGNLLRDAIDEVLGDERHHIEIVWGASS